MNTGRYQVFQIGWGTAEVGLHGRAETVSEALVGDGQDALQHGIVPVVQPSGQLEGVCRARPGT